MLLHIFRRLLLVLTAAAFVLAVALPGTVSAMPARGGGMLAGTSGNPCEGCPDKSPSGYPSGKMMACGALTCVGILAALPVSLGPEEPLAAACGYPAQASRGLPDAALPPDPFPPRPTDLS